VRQTMNQRRAATKTIATRYERADKAAKGVTIDELRDDGLVSQPRPQCAEAGSGTEDRSSA
jgi:hypothetical protein